MKTQFLERAEELDASDPLASFKKQFHFPRKNGEPCIYLCGNSLGLQPHLTQEYLDQELKNWREKGVEGHFTGDKPWVSYHKYSKETLAELVGAHADEVVAMNNLTSNLHLAMISFYQPEGRRRKILIERGAFPSDFYAVHSQIVNRGFDPSDCLIELEPMDGSDYLPTHEIIEKIKEIGDELALVMFPGVQYYTGQFFDIPTITQAAHKVGAKAGFDLAHAIGNLPMNLHEDGADFAAWCSYKYLNSGPGGVAGLFIHQKHAQNRDLERLSGWWGHDADGRFKMDNKVNPIPTVDGWQLSNSNVLSQAAHLASLSIFSEAGIERLRAKSMLLTGLLEEMIYSSATLADEVKIITPGNAEERGCQLSIYLINRGRSVFEYLVNNGVILDWREPNVIRVAPVPLYNSFAEVCEFVSILEKAIQNEG